MDTSFTILLIAVGLFILHEIVEKLDRRKPTKRRQTPQYPQQFGTQDVEDSAGWPRDSDFTSTLHAFLDDKSSKYGRNCLNKFEKTAIKLAEFGSSILSNGEHFEQFLTNVDTNQKDTIFAFLRSEGLEDLEELLEQWFEYASEDAQSDRFSHDIAKALAGELIDRTGEPTGENIKNEFIRKNGPARYTQALNAFLAHSYDWKNKPTNIPDHFKSSPPLRQKKPPAKTFASRPETPPLFFAARDAAFSNAENYRYSELDEIDLNIIRLNEIIYSAQSGDLEDFLKATHDDVFASNTLAFLSANRASDIAEVFADLVAAHHRYHHHAADFGYAELKDAEESSRAKLVELYAFDRLIALSEDYLDKNYPWQ